MPEYRVKVHIDVRPYTRPYTSSVESSTHDFFIEASDAAHAAVTARAAFLSADTLETADEHDREVEAAKAAAIAEQQGR